MIRSFKELTIWKEAMNLVEMVYQQTMTLPKTEMCGLQVRYAIEFWCLSFCATGC